VDKSGILPDTAREQVLRSERFGLLSFLHRHQTDRRSRRYWMAVSRHSDRDMIVPCATRRRSISCGTIVIAAAAVLTSCSPDTPTRPSQSVPESPATVASRSGRATMNTDQMLA